MLKPKHYLYTVGRRLDNKQMFRDPPDTYENGLIDVSSDYKTPARNETKR